MTAQPMPRWGVRFTADAAKTETYVQSLFNDNAANAKRGELWLNEPRAELYYVGADGIARRVGDGDVIPFGQIDFTGLREFADDAAAAAATPSVPVGGLYRTSSTLKIRVS